MAKAKVRQRQARAIVRAPVAAPVTRRRRAAVAVVSGIRRGVSAGARAAAATQVQLATVGGSVALALVERQGTNLPTVANIDPAILYGAAAAFLPRLLKVRGKTGALLSCAGAGVLSVGVHRSIVRGSARIGEDDDGYDE